MILVLVFVVCGCDFGWSLFCFWLFNFVVSRLVLLLNLCVLVLLFAFCVVCGIVCFGDLEFGIVVVPSIVLVLLTLWPLGGFLLCCAVLPCCLCCWIGCCICFLCGNVSRLVVSCFCCLGCFVGTCEFCVFDCLLVLFCSLWVCCLGLCVSRCSRVFLDSLLLDYL